MPIAFATAFPTAVPGLPGAGAPVVSAGFGDAVDGAIGAKRDVLPPVFAAPHPEDTAVLLATAQVAAVPADGVPAVIAGSGVEGDGVPAPTLPAPPPSAPSVQASTALASGDPAAETLPVPTPHAEPERLAAKPHLLAPGEAATKPAREAAAPDPASAAPAAAPAVVAQAGAATVAPVAAPVAVAVDAPADDQSANDNPPFEEGASAPALVTALPIALPTAPVAPVTPKGAPKSDARAVVTPSVLTSPAAAPHSASEVVARAQEPLSADPQDGFAERFAAQAPAVSVRTGSDAAPAPAASQPAAPVQQAVAPLATAAATPAIPAAAAEATPAHQPHVTAQPGRIGHEMGVAIARRVVEGGHELTVRLNPAELGRIEVKMGFSDQGTLRATVAAESAVALDLLRRDSADLGRALADAGVRADAQSFRFDTRSGDGGGAWQRQGGQGGQNGSQAHPSYAGGRGYPLDPADSEPVYRALRTSGRVDLMA